MLKKWTLFFALTLIMIFSTTTSYAKSFTLKLTGETYDTTNHEIVRTYVDSEGKVQNINIEVPSSLINTVEEGDNPLVEAKKQLAAAYESLGLKERMNVLNNVKLYGEYNEYKLTVSEEYDILFGMQKAIQDKFSTYESSNFASLSKEEQKAKYDTKDDLLKDFSQIEKEKAEKEAGLNKDKYKNESIKFNNPVVLGSVIGGILLLVLIFIVVFTKRKSNVNNLVKAEQEELSEEDNLEGIELLDGIEEIDEYNGFEKDK